MTKEIRYEYSTHRTRDAADQALDNYLATDICSEAEHPRVERKGKVWAVTLRDTALSAYL